jgi:hypothetical protein
MNLTNLNTAIQNITSLTGRYAALREIFIGFHAHIESQLEADQYGHWDIRVSDVTELNEFVIEIAGREILFIFDIEPGNTESYLGSITAYITDDYFDEVMNEIVSFTFNGSGIAEELTGLEDPVNLKIDTHCLNVVLDICLSIFQMNEEYSELLSE